MSAFPEKPSPGLQCRHNGLAGEVGSVYFARGEFHVVGHYHGMATDDETDAGYFCCPWSQCEPAELAA